MTKLLDQALTATDRLPPEVQDELARMMLAFAGREGDMYSLSEEELAGLETALGEADKANVL